MADRQVDGGAADGAPDLMRIAEDHFRAALDLLQGAPNLPVPGPDSGIDLDLALEFTPAPSVTNRHDGWTADRQRRFIAALLLTGQPARAARAAGKSTASAYALKRRPAAREFAQAWELALDEWSSRAFDRALERATKGVTAFQFPGGRFLSATERTDDLPALRAIIRDEARERSRNRWQARLAQS